jgi:uncharacterized phage-associated protein
MYSALQIAPFFLAKIDEDAGDAICNLKLQKLLYYAQGLHLALKDKPLFTEQIEAWTHGPVVPEVYQNYKGFGSGSIPAPSELPAIDDATKSLLDEVYDVYGQFSGWKLRNMTHEEPPWKNTPRGAVITHSALRDYFTTQLV